MKGPEARRTQLPFSDPRPRPTIMMITMAWSRFPPLIRLAHQGTLVLEGKLLAMLGVVLSHWTDGNCVTIVPRRHVVWSRVSRVPVPWCRAWTTSMAVCKRRRCRLNNLLRDDGIFGRSRHYRRSTQEFHATNPHPCQMNPVSNLFSPCLHQPPRYHLRPRNDGLRKCSVGSSRRRTSSGE